ncbi:MAG: hypothetical protein A2268_06295 [Candidatus Raymondbacteria bacterium RifOxyA12_full_50_37]|nr:MAG: hypothetical protein A2268_06295 [Candidatus Raymondbacteria bacterium RifOxyA12_full_50_37]OGJ94578.1 MAG: hypothetical protein A2248_15225 [Candidatus Raymondbacteria bacterium RIFOXYA2_FULL_49_16]OGK03008.1 MAG: hypothetical protein A2487_14765 [Candidatus Raymondbacteria bacterium RifOxyC12_full_50_8]OGP45527.1 MAG: hypothetical protein A2324_15305 [Candidatus Raymondbacteria bacterium RIFOXYB2_FULL_49_35]
MLNIKLDRSASSLPTYQQLLIQIEKQIQDNSLLPGTKLPPERDLAEELGIARGTVQKTYQELIHKGLVEALQGKGSFVTQQHETQPMDRKEKAVNAIDNAIDRLVQLKFSFQEIKTLIDLRLLGREEAMQDLSIAAIDCNPEALAIYEKQLFFIPHAKIAKFLLDDVLKGAAGMDKLSHFDLIVTTNTHYHDIVTACPGFADKLVQVSVSPTRDSIVKLARLTPSQQVGVICESNKFFTIIENHLKGFEIPAGNIAALYFSNMTNLDTFIKDLDAVIVPPGYSLQQHTESIAQLQMFTERGGTIIPFDFQIDRGSLLHVEERIKSILQGK